MSGWGGLGGYIEDLTERRGAAGDPTDTSSGANFTRRACDAAARAGLPPALAPHVHYVCGPYWDDAPYEPPADVSPPFEGGQCEGERYRVSFFQETTTSGRTDLTDPAVYRGPIVAANGPNESETTADRGWEYSTAGGAREYRRIIQINRQFFIDAAVTSVENLDDPADDCGNPPIPSNPRDPVDVPPSLLPPSGAPVDISDPNNPDDSPPPVVFAPDAPPEYEPFVPFVPSFPGQPPFAFPPGPGDDIPPRVGPESDLPPGGSGDDDVEVPDDDLPDECIGYAWEFYDIPANRGGIPGADPARFYEIFGSAQLRVSSRDAAVYDAPVKIDSARGVCYRSDKNLRVRGLSLNSKASFGPVRVRPVYVVVREG